MATARNGDVELCYESFGDPGRPTLLLVNGLGSQCVNYAEDWCQLFCAEGFRVMATAGTASRPLLSSARWVTPRNTADPP